MNNKLAALPLALIIASGLVYTHTAYAHTFGGDESAEWLAKVAEIKNEVNLVSKHVGDKEVLDYYADSLGEYWNENTTKEMGERNALLQKEIPDTINAVIDSAKAGDKTGVNDNISKLGGYLDESIPVRVDKEKLNNSTVQALAVTFVLREALEKYGESINATVDMNDMSQMDVGHDHNESSAKVMSDMKGMSGSYDMSSKVQFIADTSGMSMSTLVVNENAYENSMGLASTAQQMFNDLATKNMDKSSNNVKISDGFTKLLKDINDKADANTVMMDVHVGIHPTLIATYDIKVAEAAVPEFPLPALLIVISIAGVVAATRFKSQLGF